MTLIYALLVKKEARSQSVEPASRAKAPGGDTVETLSLSPLAGTLTTICGGGNGDIEGSEGGFWLSYAATYQRPLCCLSTWLTPSPCRTRQNCHIKTQRVGRDCSVFCLTEICLHSGVPDSALAVDDGWSFL